MGVLTLYFSYNSNDEYGHDCLQDEEGFQGVLFVFGEKKCENGEFVNIESESDHLVNEGEELHILEDIATHKIM